MTTRQSLQRREAALLATAEVHFTPLDDGKLCWQHWSSPDAGEPLILLHGGFGSWNHWFANIPGLRTRRDLWTVDLPGLGDSGPVPARATPAEFAEFIRRGMSDLLGSRDYELAGFSFGAMVGARLAADPRCRRFTAIGAAGCGKLHVQVPLQPPPPAATAWTKAAPVHRANLRALMFSEGASIDELAVYLHAANLARHRFNSRALSRTSDFVDALPAVGGRLVTVWGSEDATAGGAAAIDERRRRILEVRPDAAFHILPGVGHWAMYEAPAATNALLVD
jgi:pimeloyl-ACP methyl ester carboxylesterase